MDNLEMIREQYLDKYEPEEREMLVLTCDTGGAGVIYQDLCEPLMFAMAYINLETNELVTERTRFYWLAMESDKWEWIYDLKKFTIYKIRCRHIKQECRNPKIKEDIYFLSSVVERDVRNAALEKVLEEYCGTKYLNIRGMGNFEWIRSEHCYTKNVKLSDGKCEIVLECSSGNGNDAAAAKETLEKICGNLEEWSNKLKEYASRHLTEQAQDWAMEIGGDEISREEFAKRIRINAIVITESGGYVAEFFDDNIFGGHTITVEGEDVNSPANAHI